MVLNTISVQSKSDYIFIYFKLTEGRYQLVKLSDEAGK